MREISPSPQMFFIYILRSRADNGYYVGFTSDLNKRIKEHNSGRTKSLKHRLPLELVYSEEYEKKKDAKAREAQLKSWKGGDAFKNLLRSSPRLRRD